MATAAANKAKEILQSLSENRDFSVPTINLSDDAFQFPNADEMYKAVDKLTVEELTSGEVDGVGVFDKLMSTVSKHVEHEFDENRITGAEYSTTYIAAMQSAMGYGVQFLLSRDASYWQAQQAQLQAISARIELETAKVRHALMYIEANTAEANFGLTTMRLANEDVAYDTNLFRYEKLMPLEEGMAIKQNTGLEIQNNTGTYNLANILPAQKEGLDAETALRENELTALRPLQVAGITADNIGKVYNNENILPEQLALLSEQVTAAQLEITTGEYNLSNTLPQQLTNLQEQETLIREQMEVQRAQTQDLRSDNLPILGSVGKQKDLYSQQIDSYQRDAELKAAKVFSDAWTVMKTVDEGLQPPDAFTNANLQTILEVIKHNNNLD